MESKFKVGQVVAHVSSYPTSGKQLWGYLRIVAIDYRGIVLAIVWDRKSDPEAL
jgi:hypothetical protein